VIDHQLRACGDCGADLADAAPAGMLVRQVRDVPLVKVRVVEHRMHKRACRCGSVTTAACPDGVEAPAQYSPNLRAIAVYLVVFQHVPVERAALLIADVTGAAVSTGWVSAQVGRAADALGEVKTLIKSLITLAAVIGVDETSVNVAGTKQWLHVARTEELTAYHLHPSHGRAAVAEFDVLPRYSGTVVRDALAVYDAYPATHALCGAHLIRELTAVAEQYPQAQWPVQARSALADLAGLAAAAAAQGLTAIPAEQAAQPLRLYRHAVLVALRTPPRTRSQTVQGPQPARTSTQPGTRDPAVHPGPGRAVHQQRQRTRPASGQDPAEDLRLSP